VGDGALAGVISLDPKERKVLECMAEYYKQYKNCPFISEIQAATGIKKRSVINAQERLHKKGYIDRFRVGHRIINIVLWLP
jgi:Mn-dependent DtxR family transcriptional regulator